jgi:hypothetical protein
MIGSVAIVIVGGRRVGVCKVSAERKQGDMLVCRFPNSIGNFSIIRIVPLEDTTEWLFFPSEEEHQSFLEAEKKFYEDQQRKSDEAQALSLAEKKGSGVH